MTREGIIQEHIESFGKLKMEEAKELYSKAINSTDEKIKKLYFDKIILGTLYVINNYVDRNNLKMFEGSQYDIEDIRSACIEVWIRKITSIL